MQDQTLIAVAAVAATLLGSVGVIGQIIVANRQAHLQEATAYRDQAVAWRGLEEDWARTLLAGHGPETALRHGVDRTLAEEYSVALTEYKSARLNAMDTMNFGELDQRTEEGQIAIQSSLWDAESEKWQRLIPVESSVRRILIYLAQLTDLILRGRLSIHAVYDALGHDIMRHREALTAVTRYSYDYGGCIAGTNWENNWWRDLTIDQISPRIGWASALETSPGTLDRIDVFVDLIAIRAFQVGDAIHGVTGDYLVERVGDRAVLANRWKVLRRVGRLQAARYVWQASRVRELQRSRPNPFASLRYSERKAQSFLRGIGHLLRYTVGPLISVLDIPRASWNSRTAYSVARWTPALVDPAAESDEAAEAVTEENSL